MSMDATGGERGDDHSDRQARSELVAAGERAAAELARRGRPIPLFMMRDVESPFFSGTGAGTARTSTVADIVWDGQPGRGYLREVTPDKEGVREDQAEVHELVVTRGESDPGRVGAAWDAITGRVLLNAVPGMIDHASEITAAVQAVSEAFDLDD